jgi:hypothetical protein
LSGSGGLSGELSISSAYISSSSNLHTDNDATLSNINQKAKSESSFQAFPLGLVAVTFGAGLDKQVYLGTSRDDVAVGNLAMEFGFKKQLSNSTVIDISYLPTTVPSETWADPFLLHSSRTVTEQKGVAYRLKISNIAGSSFSIDTAFSEQELDDERSGMDSGYDPALLNRNFDSLYIKSSFRLYFNRGAYLSPSVIYTDSDAQGMANSNSSVAGELSLFQLYGRHKLALTMGYTDRSYDAVHPVYSLVRNDTDLRFFVAHEYQRFMGWNNLSFVSFAGYGETDSNIQFYDSAQLLVSGGVSLRF